jgi:hypothetical protein
LRSASFLLTSASLPVCLLIDLFIYSSQKKIYLFIYGSAATSPFRRVLNMPHVVLLS